MEVPSLHPLGQTLLTPQDSVPASLHWQFLICLPQICFTSLLWGPHLSSKTSHNVAFILFFSVSVFCLLLQSQALKYVYQMYLDKFCHWPGACFL